MTIPASHLLSPTDDLDNLTLTAPSYSFIIEHPSGRKILFDLALRKDWSNLPPATGGFLRTLGWKVDAPKNVSDILQDHGTSLADIDAVIWSHHHFDHVGDMTTFPPTTKLVVGPGFKEHYMPAFPTDPASTLCEAAWRDREVQELSFDSAAALQIGGFNAIDYFGDGSFYLLDAPGHTFGHMAGLARVARENNSGDSDFVFMGGDTCHFVGQFRPTVHRPLPAGPGRPAEIHASVCPGAIIDRLLANPTTPLFEMPEANAVDIHQAHESTRKMEVFDAAENVWVVIAHDQSLLGTVDFYPARINDWRRRGYADKTRWMFWNTMGQKSP
ncbi:MBL fold metallo-hydrolase [Aspergillus lucknowensis]|uniref:Beta-lactamase-like protein n=1 Tax=Aspergillus lucknowensis TaxID=176173 RepID=A0ABR4LD58_9EURO